MQYIIPRRWPLGRRIERSGDSRPTLVRFGRPPLISPTSREARQCGLVCDPYCVTLDDNAASRIDTATEQRVSRTMLRRFRVRDPVWNQKVPSSQSAPIVGRVWAAVLVHRCEPCRASVVEARAGCDLESRLLDDVCPVDWGSPSAAPADDVHGVSSQELAIPVQVVSPIRRGCRGQQNHRPSARGHLRQHAALLCSDVDRGAPVRGARRFCGLGRLSFSPVVLLAGVGPVGATACGRSPSGAASSSTLRSRRIAVMLGFLFQHHLEAAAHDVLPGRDTAQPACGCRADRAQSR